MAVPGLPQALAHYGLSSCGSSSRLRLDALPGARTVLRAGQAEPAPPGASWPEKQPAPHQAFSTDCTDDALPGMSAAVSNLPSPVRSKFAPEQLNVATSCSNSAPEQLSPEVAEALAILNQCLADVSSLHDPVDNSNMSVAAADEPSTCDALRSAQTDALPRATSTSKDDANQAVTDTIWVGDLPEDISQWNARRIFQQYGSVISMKLMPPRSGVNGYDGYLGKKSSAMVRYSSPAYSCWAVENLNGNIPTGLDEPVIVKFANPPKEQRESARQKEAPQIPAPLPVALQNGSQDSGEEEHVKKTRPCHLHSRPQSNCKFCQRHRNQTSSFSKSGEAAHTTSGELPEGNLETLELTNTETFNFNPRFRSQILKSSYFKRLVNVNQVDQVVKHIQSCTNAMPHIDASMNEPSTLFCCLYRLFTLRLSYEELQMMMHDDESPFVRVAAFLYIRFGFRPKDVWYLIQDYLFDTEEFNPISQGESCTVGKWLEGLLESDKYYSTVLPRLPQSLKCDIGARIVQLPQLRNKYSENVNTLGWFRHQGKQVEVLVNNTWQRGRMLTLDEDCAHCFRCSVQLDETQRQVVTSLGMVRRPDKGRSAKAKHDKEEEVWESWADEQNLHNDSNSEASPLAKRSKLHGSPSLRGADRKKRGRSRSRSPVVRKDVRADMENEEYSDNESLNPNTAREQYMAMLRDKATLPEGVRGLRRGTLHFQRFLMSHIQGYNNGPTTPRYEYTVFRQKNSAGSSKDYLESSESWKSAKRLEAAVKDPVKDPKQEERNRRMQQVFEKYGSAGAAKHARLEYHEAALGKANQQKGLDFVDTPDLLRLG